ADRPADQERAHRRRAEPADRRAPRAPQDQAEVADLLAADRRPRHVPQPLARRVHEPRPQRVLAQDVRDREADHRAARGEVGSLPARHAGTVARGIWLSASSHQPPRACAARPQASPPPPGSSTDAMWWRALLPLAEARAENDQPVAL